MTGKILKMEVIWKSLNQELINEILCKARVKIENRSEPYLIVRRARNRRSQLEERHFQNFS